MKRVSKVLGVFLLFLFVAFAFNFTSVKALSAEVEFEKVTSGEVVDGKYLIVYEDGSKVYVFNSTLSTLDSTKNYVEATINDDKITISEDYAFTIEGTAILSNSGKYIYQGSDSNKLLTSDALENNDSITINNGEVAIIAASTHLRFNKANDQMRFRYYKSSSYSSQQAICLYKMVVEEVESGFSKLQYELNGGTNTNDAPTSYEEGQALTLPIPTKEGNEFLGWYLNSDFSGESITEISADQTGDIKLYAKWEEEAWHMFSSLSTSASLNIEYDVIGEESETSSSTLEYTGTSTTNMTASNNASLVNLDENLFSVTANKNSSNLYPGLNKSGEIRVYANNYILVTCLTSKIQSVEIEYKSSELDVFVGDKEIQGVKEGSVYKYQLENAESFTVKNSSGSQYAIYKIVINYSDSFVEYENVTSQIRFGTCINKELFDKLGDNVTFGVALIKTNDLGSNELTDETEGVILTDLTPAQVTSPFGTVESSEGNYYQFAVVIAGLGQEEYDVSLSARAYVVIEGEYYFMEVSEFSIKTLSEFYLKAYENDENIKEHFGVLKNIIG